MLQAPYNRQGTPFSGESIEPGDSASQVAWAKRQQGPKRGLTRKVKLTRGHWIVDHRVPTAIKNSTEPKWAQGEWRGRAGRNGTGSLGGDHGTDGPFFWPTVWSTRRDEQRVHAHALHCGHLRP